MEIGDGLSLSLENNESIGISSCDAWLASQAKSPRQTRLPFGYEFCDLLPLSASNAPHDYGYTVELRTRERGPHAVAHRCRNYFSSFRRDACTIRFRDSNPLRCARLSLIGKFDEADELAVVRMAGSHSVRWKGIVGIAHRNAGHDDPVFRNACELAGLSDHTIACPLITVPSPRFEPRPEGSAGQDSRTG